jgi:sec-independent protein translocase protein TatA
MATFQFISGQEIFIIMVVALLLFGANKIPEIAKGLGKGMREFKKATDDIKKEFDENTKDIKEDIKDVTDSVKKDIKL